MLERGHFVLFADTILSNFLKVSHDAQDVEGNID